MKARAQSHDENVGATIAGRYRIERLLGSGGMARVYRVLDQTNGALLALKRLGGSAADPLDENARLRFRREFHTLSGLRHPRIVSVHDFGVDSIGPYYTMELLDGADLYDAGRLPIAEAASILRDVASALAFLHVRGLLHRDLAPRNVRRTADGRAKLIDFGILATPGVAGDIAGTPSYIAPEVLRGLPLDHRVDLFGFGALAYRLLSGRSAYRAHTIHELEALWKRPLPSFGALGVEVPRAIEDLVFALLSLDPLARPSAAEIIERLTIAGNLPALPASEAVHGYLASGVLLGRDEELAKADHAIHQSARGEGAALLIEAPSGMGKSRLLREISVRAQVAGATVVAAERHDDDARPYGTINVLARALFDIGGSHAIEAARPYASILVRALPTLIRERFGNVQSAHLGRDPAERRMRIQAALHAWMTATTRRLWLVLLVEDLQRCDDASAAVLASVAHDAHDFRLLLVSTLRTDEPVRATDAIATLKAASELLRLRGLEVGEVEGLVTALFGEVPNTQRLAQKLANRASGSPLLCVEFAKEMVRRGAVRYIDGMWAIDPGAEIALPADLAETLNERIAALSPAARAISEVLAMVGNPLGLRDCVELADNDELDSIFVALDELGQSEVIVSGTGSYRFRHDGYREAVLRGIGQERARELHLRIAKHLAPKGVVPPALRAQVGWHLLRGGDLAAAAPLLEAAGKELYQAHAFREARAPLEAALEAYSHPRDARRRAEICQMLLFVGLMSERELALRYEEPALQSLRLYSGLAIAERLSVIGRPFALAIGISVAMVAWLFAPRGRRGPSPFAAIAQLFLAVAFAAGIHATSWDLRELKRVLTILTPLSVIEKGILRATHLLTRCMVWLASGNFGALRRDVRDILRILESGRWRLAPIPVDEMDMRAAEGAARFMDVLDRVAEQNPTFEDALREVRRLELKFFELGDLQARIAYHRSRGEESRALEYQKQAELLLVRLGSVWQMEAWLAIASSFAYAMTRDVVGLRGAIEQLERLIREGCKFEPALALASGEYRRETGDAAHAIVDIERALSLSEDNHLVRLPALAALAEAHLANGNPREARRVATEGIAAASDPDFGQTIALFRSQRALALAEAADGETERAAERLDEAIEEAARIASPMLCGSLHEARARVAHTAEDLVGARYHLERTKHWFMPTGNPALIASASRLAELIEGTRLSVAPSVNESGGEATMADVATQHELLAGCHHRVERVARALEILIQATGAQAGHLYFVRGDRVSLEASRGEGESPVTIEQLREAVRTQSGVTTHDSRYRSLMLRRRSGAVAGIAIMIEPARDIDPAICDGLARELEPPDFSDTVASYRR